MSSGTHVDPAVLEADVIKRREELAQTVGALSHKLDVKTRAQDKATELRSAATTDRGRLRPELLVLVGTLFTGAAALAWWRHRYRTPAAEDSREEP